VKSALAASVVSPLGTTQGLVSLQPDRAVRCTRAIALSHRPALPVRNRDPGALIYSETYPSPPSYHEFAGGANGPARAPFAPASGTQGVWR
jgi:hypothetical protein